MIDKKQLFGLNDKTLIEKNIERKQELEKEITLFASLDYYD